MQVERLISDESLILTKQGRKNTSAFAEYAQDIRHIHLDGGYSNNKMDRLNGEILTVVIKCKDARGEDFEISPLQIDFGNIGNDSETVAYQFSGLRPIQNELEKIRSAIDKRKLANTS